LNPGSTVKVVGMTQQPDLAVTPNHHAHHAPFAGPLGLLAALTMTVGRRADADLAIELTRLRAADRLVDVGCGPGTAARLAATVGASVTGVDPARVMLRVARWSGQTDRLTYLRGAAESLPLDAGAATVVWSLASVHHWQDLEAALAEVHRVLRAGGRFLAVERRTRPGATGLAAHGWTDAQAHAFADRCRAAGFDPAEVGEHGCGRRRPVLAVLASRP
jgi:ubiquinone/menaquinone biosynthesis C-methylase UbiE